MNNLQDPASVFRAIASSFGTDVYLQRRIFKRGTGLYSLVRNEENKLGVTIDIYNEDLEYNSSMSYNGRRPFDLPGANPTNFANPDTLNVDESYWSNTIERWTVRYTMASRKTQIPEMESDRPEGITHNIPLVAYFPAEANPTEGDRVYIPDKRFANGTTLWSIRYAHGEIGLDGTPAYWLCGLIRISIEGQQLGG